MNRSRAALLRLLDLALIVLSSPVWAPAFLLLALAVLVSSGAPVFFRQDRVGLGGRSFRVWKFRSMVVGENPLVPEPSRITPIGAVLRRTSLDELPQLLNIVRGEMSLVGPRPMLPAQVELLSELQGRRHLVRPGLTGRAQVNGRNSIAWDARIEHDCAWATNPTIADYASILVRTFGVVASGDGLEGHDPSDPIVELAEVVDIETIETIETIELDDDDRLVRRRVA